MSKVVPFKGLSAEKEVLYRLDVMKYKKHLARQLSGGGQKRHVIEFEKARNTVCDPDIGF